MLNLSSRLSMSSFHTHYGDLPTRARDRLGNMAAAVNKPDSMAVLISLDAGARRRQMHK